MDSVFIPVQSFGHQGHFRSTEAHIVNGSLPSVDAGATLSGTMTHRHFWGTFKASLVSNRGKEASMPLDQCFSRPLGVLCIFASLPILEAGVAAARAFFHVDHLRCFLSSLGSLAAFLLLIAGILLYAKFAVGRSVAYWAAGVSTPAHI